MTAAGVLLSLVVGAALGILARGRLPLFPPVRAFLGGYGPYRSPSLTNQGEEPSSALPVPPGRKTAGWWPWAPKPRAPLPPRLSRSDSCPACGLDLRRLTAPSHVKRCARAPRPHLHQQCPWCDARFCTEVVNPAWFCP